MMAGVIGEGGGCFTILTLALSQRERERLILPPLGEGWDEGVVQFLSHALNASHSL